MISTTVKLGITFWLLGLIIVLVGCFFGLAGVESAATVIVIVGAASAAIGAFFGLVEFLTFVWKQ
jgi:hypothetical protein